MISICIFFDLKKHVDIVIFGRILPFKFSQQPRHGCAYQWLDNVYK